MDHRRDGAGWAESWQTSWDRLEQAYVPDRERWIAALLDVVETTATASPRVLDLACGTGTVTRRLLDRFPRASATAVDVDPVLLTIASATFADDERVRVVRADLRDPAWVDAVPERTFDAVLTATALHWLSQDVVGRLYRDLAGVVRRGGVLAHAEVMPLEDAPHLGAGLAAVERRRCAEGRSDSDPEWDTWWEGAALDPALSAAAAQRREVFGSNYPTEEFSPPADWHIAALRRAGFVEASVLWRSGTGAVVAAVR